MNMKTCREILTPEKAKEYLELNTYEGQRPLKPERVANLVDRILSGRFRSAEIGIAHYDGKQILINGQHQCTAIIKTGREVQSNLNHHYCATPEDLATAFSEYDQPDQTRSVREVIHAYRVAAKIECTDACANQCSSAIAWCEHGDSFQSKVRREDRARLLFGEDKVIAFVAEIFYSYPTFLRKIPIIAAAIKCFRKSPEDAVKFWLSVRDGEMLTKSDPAYKVRQHCEINGCCAGRPNARETHVKCIHGWNAFRKGTSTKLKYFADTEMPEAV